MGYEGEKMTYHAKIRLEDDKSNDVFKVEGDAEKALEEQLNFIKTKHGHESVLRILGKFLADDAEELGKSLEKVGFVFMRKPKK